MINFSEWLTLEAKEERQIYYHGTSSALLKTIMSQGLIPEPKKRAWADDPDAGFSHASRASIGGIYVTTNLLTATASAFRAAEKGKVDELIVVMDIHPYSLVGDEDDHMNAATIAVPGLLNTEYSVSNVYFSLLTISHPNLSTDSHGLAQDREYVEKAKAEYVSSNMRHLTYKLKNIHPELAKRAESLFAAGFVDAIERQISHISKRQYDDFYDRYFPRGTPKIPQPDKQQAEKKWQMFLDRLTKTVKQTAHPNNRASSFNNTARLLKPVGFSGKDKIVCIIQIHPYTRNLEKNYTPVTIQYGNPPEKLIKDWETQQGEWKPNK